jgi:hypothetical protein
VKNPKRVAAGRINGLKSGKARRHRAKVAKAGGVDLAKRRRFSRYWAAIAEGVCVDCGADHGQHSGVRCDACARSAAESAKAYYNANAKARRAYQRAYYAAKKAA